MRFIERVLAAVSGQNMARRIMVISTIVQP